MKEVIRVVLLGMVFALAAVAWMVLGGVMVSRTGTQERALGDAVSELWGEPHRQPAPAAMMRWQRRVRTVEAVLARNGQQMLDADGQPVMREVERDQTEQEQLPLTASTVSAKLGMDQRRKGLIWYTLYDVDFSAQYRAVNETGHDGAVNLSWSMPVYNGLYDDFRFVVNGVDRTDDVTQNGMQLGLDVPLANGEEVAFSVSYRSRGRDSWTYDPGASGSLRDFSLDIATDVAEIDFPADTISPSTREAAGGGEVMGWRFRRLLTSKGMGVVLPQRIQPGEVAASMSFSAPISLGLFMLWLWVLSVLRGIDLHPVNYLLMAGAFFAFHLLFGYSADFLPTVWAFALSAVVSVTLVVSYLRLVVGSKFAWREAGLAQLVYLVGFSAAHFADGLTGLTITVLGILTLFMLMQLTAKVKWSEVFGARA